MIDINEKKYITIGDNVYLLSYTIYLIFSIIATSFYMKFLSLNIMSSVNIICVLLLVIYEIVYKKYTVKQLWIIIFILIIGIININIINNNTFIMIGLYIFCARNIEFKKIIKVSLCISSIFLLLIILSSIVGIINNIIENNIILGELRRREYLGFLYALFPSTYLFNIVFMFTLLQRKKIKYYQILVMFFLNYVVYFYTDARLNFFLINLFLLIVFSNKVNNKVSNTVIFNIPLSLCFIFSAIISIMSVYFYDGGDDIDFLINLLLEGRISMAQDAMRLYGISLFGNFIQWSGAGLDITGRHSELAYFYVDCAYAKLLIEYGVVIFMLFICTFTVVAYKFRKNTIMLLIFVMIAIHGIFDDLILYIQYDTFLLAPSLLLSNDKI